MSCDSPPSPKNQEFMEHIRLINRKWTIIAVISIGNYKGVRFNKLKKDMGSISPKTLSHTLFELCQAGVIKTERILGPPTVMEYFLTEKGRKLRDAIFPTVDWMVSNSIDCKLDGILLAVAAGADS